MRDSEAPQTRPLNYKEAYRLAKVAEAQVADSIAEARASLGSPELVRGHLDAPRIKLESAVLRKAKENRVAATDAIAECEDFLGLRMVCHNLQDVQRAADLVGTSLREMGGAVRRKDFIAEPVPTGYRAIHLLTRIPIKVGQLAFDVPCEVQIRTLLQDAWAKLSRADLYRSKIPRELIQQFSAMAKSLADADQIAEEVRGRITRPVAGKKANIDAVVSGPSLAFIYQRAFKEDPPTYLVDWMLQKIGDADIRSDALDAALQEKAFLERAQKKYMHIARWPADPTRQLEWAVDYLLHGMESALSMAAAHGQSDWDDIDAQHRSEVQATIPSTWDEFERAVSNGELDFRELAAYFEASRECICGEESVEYDDFVEAVIEHYGLRGDERQTAYNDLIGFLQDAGIEDADGSPYCSYHHSKMNKDD